MKHGSKGIYVMDCGEGAQVGSRVQPNGVEHGSIMGGRGWSREGLVVGWQRGEGGHGGGGGDGGWGRWFHAEADRAAFTLAAWRLWLLLDYAACGLANHAGPPISFARGRWRRRLRLARVMTAQPMGRQRGAMCTDSRTGSVLAAEDWSAAVGT